MDVSIRPAHQDDLLEVARIGSSLDRDALEDAESVRTGFLVSHFTLEQYADLLVRSDFFYVAEAEGEVVGFVIAYGNDRIQPDEWLNLRMLEYFPNVTVIKQVAVDARYSGRGIGSRLYETVVDRNRQTPVIAAVVAEPENRASMALHRKAGFQPFLSLTPPDGLQRVVWLKEADNVDVLFEQMNLAADLYQHEDTLNWQKLNNFLYVTVGLVALCSLSLTLESGMARAWTLLVSGLLGIAVAFAFFVTMRSGLAYMHSRKESFGALENALVRNGALRVSPDPRSTPMKHGLVRSATGRVLLGLPLAVSLGWLAMVIFSLVSLNTLN